MDMESISGKMGIDTKVSGYSAWSMDRVQIFLQMGIHIQALTNKVNQMDKDSINGKMDAYTLVNLGMV